MIGGLDIAGRSIPSSDFHARQLWLLVAGWIEPAEALEIVNTSDETAAQSMLDDMLCFADDEDFCAAHRQTAHAYISTLSSGSAPAARGESRDDAIVVINDYAEEGIAMQYEWLAWRFGERDVNWTMESRGHEPLGDIVYDWFKVKTISSDIQLVEFDITAFYGRW